MNRIISDAFGCLEHLEQPIHFLVEGTPQTASVSERSSIYINLMNSELRKRLLQRANRQSRENGKELVPATAIESGFPRLVHDPLMAKASNRLHVIEDMYGHGRFHQQKLYVFEHLIVDGTYTYRQIAPDDQHTQPFAMINCYQQSTSSGCHDQP